MPHQSVISALWPAKVAFALPLLDDDVLPLHLLEEIAQTLRAGNATLLLSPCRVRLRRVKEALTGMREVPLRERLAAFHAAHPLPPRTGKVADKAFFDELSGN